MKGFPLKRIAAHLNISSDSEISVSGFSIDSRKVQRGELFFALPGAKVDGHDYLKEVAQRGACGAVVSKKYRGEHFGLVLLPVDDVVLSLQSLAQIAASARKEKCIALTGSVGKTTTKEFLVQLLKQCYRVGYTEGNSNTKLTFPLFWLNLSGEYDYLVVEMGMTEAGHIRRLVEIAPPDIAVITRIASAHIGFFSDGFHGIARAKAEILSNVRTKDAVISWQAMEFEEIREAGNCKKWIYGEGGDFLLKTSEKGIVVEQRGGGSSPLLSPPFKATHLLENLLAAISVARVVGMEWEEIAAACAKLKPHELRYEMEMRGGVTFVKDCYNANPLSMRAALSNLPQPKKEGRRIGVLGMMVDQGAFSKQFHTEVAEFALGHLDALLCIGAESQHMADVFAKAGRPVEYFTDLTLLKQRLFESVREGDVVLIKGSNFLKLWQLMDQ